MLKVWKLKNLSEKQILDKNNMKNNMKTIIPKSCNLSCIASVAQK